LIGIKSTHRKTTILRTVEQEDNAMRKLTKAMACDVHDDFAMWIIAAGVLVGTYLALAI
jgi:hypothetical protein